MKVKTSELSGVALDWAVAILEFPKGSYGGEADHYSGNKNQRLVRIPDKAKRCWTLAQYSTNWAQGGPIIELEKMIVVRGNDLIFPKGNENGDTSEPLYLARYSGSNSWMHGQTPLIAAMRCYVASKLGDEVDIPDKLL